MGTLSQDENERDRKRVRFTGPESANGEETKNGEVAKTGALSATSVVELRFMDKPDDLLPAGAREPHPEALTSRPPFLHQIVPKETVHGWANLTVAVYVHLPTLSYWIDSDGEHAELPAGSTEEPERTDVPALLAPFLKGGLCPTRAAFEEAINAPFVSPLKNCILRYEKVGRKFAVYKENFAEKGESGMVRNEDFHSFHRRMAFLMFVHIDGASFIDDEDPRWEVYVVMEEQGDASPEFVGYATTYPFSVLRKSSSEEGQGMRFADRIRVSQVLVSPLQQGNGHGSKLLQAVYKDAKERNAIEVTVEDPSRGFRILRDVTDLKRSYAAGILDPSKAFPREEETTLLELLRKDMLLTSGQAKRCLEVHQLKYTERDDESEYKQYRLWVKRRLFKENYEVLDNYDKEERKTKLAEIYQDYEEEYLAALARLNVTKAQ